MVQYTTFSEQSHVLNLFYSSLFVYFFNVIMVIQNYKPMTIEAPQVSVFIHSELPLLCEGIRL